MCTKFNTAREMGIKGWRIDDDDDAVAGGCTLTEARNLDRYNFWWLVWTEEVKLLRVNE